MCIRHVQVLVLSFGCKQEKELEQCKEEEEEKVECKQEEEKEE